MKKTCGTWLGVYAVVAVATGLIVIRRMPEGAAVIPAALFGGGVLWMGILYLIGIGQKLAKAKMIRRALSGDMPADGEKIAAIGRIGPSGSGTLTSPLTKTECVAYRYDIRQGPASDDFTWYEGFALTPSAIQGRQRNIKLLAWSDFQLLWKFLPADEVWQNAEEYVKQTEFQPPTGANIRATIQKTLEIYKDENGTVRWDQQGTWTQSQPPNLQVSSYRERVFKPGDTVCVIGRYSASRGGIVPSDSPLVDPVTIESGEEEAFVKRATRGAVGYFIGALIFCGIYFGGLIFFLASVPLELSEQQDRSRVPSWTEIRLEQVLDREVRPRMVRMGILSPSSGRFAVMLDKGQAKGRVKAEGHDVSVTRAVLDREGDLRVIAIDDTALVLTLDGHQNPRRLTMYGREVPLADAVVQIVGATENGIAGRVTVASGDVAGRVTFDAVP